MTGKAARAGGWKRRGEHVTLLVVTLAVVLFGAHGAFAQVYPRCIDGCTAKDVSLENVTVTTSGTGVPGEPINASIISTMNFNRGKSYCVRIVADVYIDGVLAYQDMVSQPYVFFVKGFHDLLLGEIFWPYGSVLELRNVQIFWSVDNNLNDASLCVGCEDYGPGSKCVGYASFEITQPLVANFEVDPSDGCVPLTVQFTDTSTGGYSIDPYSYDWAFGDGTAHSTLQNPSHLYESPNAYTVTLTVTDTEGSSDTFQATVTTVDCNEPPVTFDDAMTTNENESVDVGILLNDVDSDGTLDPSSIVVTKHPSNGTVTIDPVTGLATYTPNAGWCGEEYWKYTVDDDDGATSNEAKVVMTVICNEPPVALDDAATTDHDTPVDIAILANDSDSDGNIIPSTVVVTKQPDHGTVTIDPVTGLATYTPNAGWCGEEYWKYTVNDNDGATSNEAKVVMTVICNEPPVALDDAETTNQADPIDVEILVNDSDSDGTIDPTTVVVTKQPSNGSVTIDPVTGVATYTPNPEWCGEEYWKYTVDDNDGATSNEAEVVMTVLCNQPPNAVDDQATTPEDTPVVIPVLGNDSDPEDDPLTVDAVTQPSHGTIVVNPDGTVIYTPDPDYCGIDAFTYTISDDLGAQDTATVSVDVTCVDDQPALLVLKSGNPDQAQVGDVVNYTITVTHHQSSDGSPVEITEVTDSLSIPLAGPTGDDGDGLLETGETWSYIGSREVQADDPQELVNTVCISGLDVEGESVTDCDSTTTIISHLPILDVTKTGVPAIAQVGDSISYSVTVSHALASDGSPVSAITVFDSLNITLSGPLGDDGDELLENGEAWIYTGLRTATPGDPHELVNEACATGTDLDGDAISACGSTTTQLEHQPHLLVEKSSSPVLAAIGDQIDYTIAVSHAPASDGSPVQLTEITDSLGVVLSGPSGDDGDGVLEASEVWYYSGSRTALESDPHDLINTVCARGIDADGDSVSDCGSTTTEIAHPGITVIKQADRQFASIGETIIYTYTIWNTGDVDLENVTATDNILGTLSGPSSGDNGNGILETNETWIYLATHTVTEDDLPGPLVNTANIEAWPPVGDPVSDSDVEDVEITFDPGIEVAKEASSGPFAIGDTITYTYTVTNMGNVTLSGITVGDDLLGAVTLSQTELIPNEVTSGTLSYLVTQDDVDAGSITNVATAVGIPPFGPSTSDEAIETVTLDRAPRIEIEKNASDGSFAVGDTITYTYTITNTGNVTLTAVTASDDLLGPIALGATTLVPQASTTGTLVHEVTQDDFDAGLITNIGSTSASAPDGSSVDDTDVETVLFGQTPAVEVVKVASDGPFSVGETIIYTYTITNTGNVTLAALEASDDLLGSITLGTTTLAPTDTTSGTLTYVVTQEDVDDGLIVNVATVSATPPIGPPVTDEDDETVDFGQTPSIEVLKSASGGPFAVGDVITYAYTVTNTGNVSLTNVSASDDLLGPITLGTSTLAPQASTTGMLTHVVTQDDFDAGSIVNVAEVAASPPSGLPVTDEDNEIVGFGHAPGVEVLKDASNGPFAVGDTITYTYTVTNTGNVTLTDVTASDDLLGPITLGASTLAPLASTSGTLTHVVTQDDFDNGFVFNVVTAAATPPLDPPISDEDDETVLFDWIPAIDVVKEASDGPFAVGDTITYTYTVTNTGNVSLTNVSASDDLLGPITLGTSTLAPQASTTGTLTHVVTQDDFDDGSIVNVASAIGTPPAGPSVGADATERVTFTQTPAVEVVKEASDGPFAVGDTITYTYTVTNTGNVTLTGVTASDDLLGPITLDASTLAPLASTSGILTHVVTQDDFDDGSIVNVATSAGVAPDQSTVEDTDDETVGFGRSPDIEVVKEASDGPFVVGDSITYSYIVTNTGNVTLTNVAASDDLLGSITLDASTLAPLASTSGTLTHVVTQDDFDDGSIINVATATGIAPDQSTVEDTDNEIVTFGRSPAIEVVKEASDGPFVVGDTITYTYTVTNTGNVTLTSVTASDDLLGLVTLSASTLAPQASTSGTLTHVVTQDDFNGGSIINVATATAVAPDQSTVDDTDDESVTFSRSPAITVVKEASDGPFVVGDTITYTYTVTNAGNVTLASVTASDDLLGLVTLGASTLAPQASTSGTLTHVVSQGDYDNGLIVNVVTATGIAPDQSTVEDTDDETVAFGQTPAIEVIKDASAGPFAVGDTITYTYTVTNTGNVTLASVTASDDLLGLVTLSASTLAPQASTSGTLTYVVTQDDFDGGSIINAATASGVAPDQTGVEDNDQESVPFDRTPAIEVLKDASDGPFVVGDTITYTYTVTNTGNVTLTNVVAGDDLLGSISLDASTLAPLASASGTLTYVVIQDDFDSGSIVNVATATGVAPDQSTVEDTDDETVGFGRSPAIKIIKTASEGPFAVGDTVTYTYTVTNTGNVTLTNVVAGDDLLGSISLDASTLAPLASTSGTLTHVVTQVDFDDGSIVNVATATGVAPDQSAVQDTDNETVTFGRSPAIEVLKEASEGPFVVGDTITYTYTVTNTGNVTLTNVAAGDDLLGSISLDASTLAPLASTSGTLTHVVTQDDFDAGSIVNVATATGVAPDQSTVEDTDDATVTFQLEPALDIVKQASEGPFAVGDTITYSYVVTNTGNVTLTNVAASDDLLGSITLDASTLAPQDVATGTLSHVVTQQDIDAGSIVNVGFASGVAPDQTTVEDTDDETVAFGRTPAIEVIKDASAGPFAVGDTITYTYTVTNTGNVTLTSITASDDLLGLVTLGASTLTPQASTTGTLTYVVTQDDFDIGSIVNVATSAGIAPDQTIVEDEDAENVAFDQNPLLAINKTADVDTTRLSETVSYQILVTNIGNVTLNNVVVDDPILGVSQNLGSLAPGASQTINLAYGPVVEGDFPAIVNTAFASADEAASVQDSHTVEVEEIRVDLELIKTVDIVNPEAGDLVTFEITVSNAPNFADATNVEVTDTLPDGYTFVSFSASRGSYAYSGNESIWVVGDLLAGESATLQVLAIAHETGDHVTSAEVTAHDQEDIDSAPGNADLIAEDDDDDAVVFVDTPIADLLVLKDVDNATVEEGDTITFTVTAYNAGPYTSTSIVMQDVLPAGLTYVSDSTGGSYDPVGGTWDVGDLLVGESKAFTISALVESGTAGLTLTNTALVIQNEVVDLSTANNQASADVTVGEGGGGGGGSSDECEGKVIISEIAWAGTAADPEHEWIELQNIGGTSVDLSGWTLRWRKKNSSLADEIQWKTVILEGVLDGSSMPACSVDDTNQQNSWWEFTRRMGDPFSWKLVLQPTIRDTSYLILERRRNETINNIEANIVYDLDSPYPLELLDTGEIIELLDPTGTVIDSANAFESNSSAWPAGDPLAPASMERIDPLGPDLAENWRTSSHLFASALDAEGEPIRGTPGAASTFVEIGYEEFLDLQPSQILAGTQIELPLELTREVRQTSGWPLIDVLSIKAPNHESIWDVVGAGGQTTPSYRFAGRSEHGRYWLSIDTASFPLGDHLVCVTYGPRDAIVVPLTIIDR